MSRKKVAAASAIPEGRAILAELDGRNLLVGQVEGTFYAVDAVCTHADGLLQAGELCDGYATCPLHGAEFDIRTGKVAAETPWADDLETFTIIVDGDDLCIEVSNAPGRVD